VGVKPSLCRESLLDTRSKGFLSQRRRGRGKTSPREWNEKGFSFQRKKKRKDGRKC
jgi:hypothetical protein